MNPGAFADDIALVIVEKYLQDIQNLLSVAFSRYFEWMNLPRENLLNHKTGIVLTHYEQEGDNYTSSWSI